MSTLLGRALTLLGTLAILSCAGIVALAVLERPIPDVLQNIAVGSMTALGALLARGAGGDSSAEQDPERPETRG